MLKNSSDIMVYQTIKRDKIFGRATEIVPYFILQIRQAREVSTCGLG